MSLRSLLKQRCRVLRLSQGPVDDGSPSASWTYLMDPADLTAVMQLRCYLDLSFIRKGRDPVWTPEAGRPGDRSGVLFLFPDAPVRSGDRIEMLRGPSGTFKIEQAVDEPLRPSASKAHHLEVYVVEVAPQRARAARTQTPYDGAGGRFPGSL